MGTEKINRLKIVLVEQGKNREMVSRAVRKKRSYCSLVFLYKSTLFGDANEDSLHIECGCKKID